jgi:hypothetical protein
MEELWESYCSVDWETSQVEGSDVAEQTSARLEDESRHEIQPLLVTAHVLCR